MAPRGNSSAGEPATPGPGRPWPVLAALVIAWLFTGMTPTEWLAFGTCVAAASVVYLIARARR